jgi:hypothetical protein
VARALFNLNAHCGMSSLLGEKEVHLLGKCCPVQPLKVKEFPLKQVQIIARATNRYQHKEL